MMIIIITITTKKTSENKQKSSATMYFVLSLMPGKASQTDSMNIHEITGCLRNQNTG